MNVNPPLVSVIIPVYNASATLSHCLDSLSAQTYPHIELLVVDDCSKDDSLSLLTSYSDMHSCPGFSIRILRHTQNRGVAAARNTALQSATGYYIYHVDADDSIEPDTLSCLVDEAQKKNSDIVGHEWYLTFNRNERHMRQPACSTPVEGLQYMMCGVMRWNLWLFLVKRSLYVAHDIRFAEGMNMGEDLMVTIKLFACANNITIIHIPFYHYEQTNSNSLTKTYSHDHIRQVTSNVAEVERFISQSSYAATLLPYIHFLKLNIKLPLLITDDASHYEQWLQWFPESNGHVMGNKQLPLRSRLLQWMAVKRLFLGIKLYYRLVFKLVYGIIYR